MIQNISGSNQDALWQTLLKEVTKSEPLFYGFDGAINRFLGYFANGFDDDGYHQHERAYKTEAATKLAEVAPLEKALTATGLGEQVLKVYQSTNLLARVESIRIRELLKGPHADAFIQGAARFATNDVKGGLAEMAKAMSYHDIVKWTVATYLPFLWRPDTHMF